MVYIALGSLTLFARSLPDAFSPAITKKGAPYGCGFFISVVQLVAGAGGGLLDACFQRTKLDRRCIIATKSSIQLGSNALRFTYFGTLAWSVSSVPPWSIPVACGVAMTTVSLAGLIVAHMTNQTFRRWTGWVVVIVGISFIVRELYRARNCLAGTGARCQ